MDKSKIVQFVGYMWIVFGVISLLMILFGLYVAFVAPEGIEGRVENYISGGVCCILGLIFASIMLPLGINTLKFRPSARIANLFIGPPILIFFYLGIIFLAVSFFPFLFVFKPLFILFGVSLYISIFLAVALIWIFSRSKVKDLFKRE